EALCNFDKLGSQPLRGNVVLIKNTQRGAHLTYIEVQFFLEESDILSLLRGQFFQRTFRIANKFIDLLLRDADDNCRASDTAADSDAAGICPDLLSIGSGNRGEEAHAYCCNGGQIPLHGRAPHRPRSRATSARALGSFSS